jgi:hypothetical protein
VHPKAHLPPCEERQRLRILYEVAAKSYSTAINEVLASRGKTPKQEHDRVRAFMEEARSASKAAQLALQAHRQEHGC